MVKLVGVLSNEPMLQVGIIDRLGKLMWEESGTEVLDANIVESVVLEFIAVTKVLVDSISKALIIGVVAVILGDIIKDVVMASVSEVVVGKVGIIVTLGIASAELGADIRTFCFVSKAFQLSPHEFIP